MKKVIWVIVLGLLGAFAADRCLGSICRRIVRASGFRLVEIYSDRVSPHVLVAGNSRAMQGVDGVVASEVAGETVYNIGYNGLAPEVVCILIKDAVEKHSTIRQVLVEASCFWPINTGGDFKPLASFSPRLFEYTCNGNRVLSMSVHLSHLYRYNSELFERSFFYLRKSDQAAVSPLVINAAVIAAPSPEQYFPSEISQRARSELDSLKKFLDDKKVGLTLFVAPYHASARGRFADYDALLRSASVVAGGELLDFGWSLKEDRFFADRLHLNRFGAAEFTKMLLKGFHDKEAGLRPRPVSDVPETYDTSGRTN